MLPFRAATFAKAVAVEDDLADLFANGETGDWWRFDEANTNGSIGDGANQLGTAFSTATGMVNGLTLSEEGAAFGPELSSDASSRVYGRFGRGGLDTRLFRNWGSTIAQPGTIILGISNGDTATHIIFTGSSGTNRWQLSNDSTDDLVMFAPGTEFDTTINSPIGNHVLTCEFNGASSKLRRDGTQIATGNPGTGGTNRLTIGAVWDGTFGGAFGIYSILFINRLLTSDERDRAERLFGSHMGISW
jgi:hypothetical protein